jgi:hypothetical protein
MDRRDALRMELRRQAPRIPRHECEAVLDHALSSPGLRSAAAGRAVRLSLIAYARHVFTEYDALLEDGYDADSARHFVLDDLNGVLSRWGVADLVDDAPEERT